jgi:uncharacterized protein DUF3999
MKARVLALAVALLIPNGAQHFSNTRAVAVKDTAHQNYAVVDQDIWQYSRPDLADIRLYSPDGEEVPYSLREKRGGGSAGEVTLQPLELGRKDGQTEFAVDLSSVPEYDRITLQLKTKNFVGHAHVLGASELHAAQPTDLGTFTIYDFSKEKLGSSFTIKLPLSRFTFLRIQLSDPVTPEDVTGVNIAKEQEDKTAWLDLGIKPVIAKKGKDTEITWTASDKVPIERVSFDVDPRDVNFRRDVAFMAGKKLDYVRGGEISRIHMTRNGRKVDSEDLAMDLPTTRAANYKITIHNGDDPPLRLRTVHVLQVERRLYFDPRGNAQLQLFYGDDRAHSPEYDYAKLFSEDENAARAELAAPRHNEAYVPPPDDRPWTDQHPALVWIAMAIAIIGLALIAWKSLR